MFAPSSWCICGAPGELMLIRGPPSSIFSFFSGSSMLAGRLGLSMSATLVKGIYVLPPVAKNATATQGILPAALVCSRVPSRQSSAATF